MMDSSLHLPRSTLPAQPLPEEATTYLKRCADELYAWQSARPSSAVSGDFTLHDGPPYANGNLHAGHALNKITKDIICRFQLGQGKRVSYIPGWDCHGLPIELKALQQLNVQDHASFERVEIRKEARRLAEKVVQQQMQDFRQWAIMADWDMLYRTMDTDFVRRQLRVFKDMIDKDLVHRRYRPVYWSPSAGTALSVAELEYDENHVSTAAFVKFPLTRLPEAFAHVDGVISAVVWAPTPWTLPANKAIAVKPDIQYSLVKEPGSFGKRLIVVAEPLLEKLREMLSFPSPLEPVVESIQGSSLVGSAEYVNVFHGIYSTPQPFIPADIVSTSTGTGLMHMAPGHDMDHYKVCCSFGIPFSSPIDDKCQYTAEACPHSPELLAGLDVLSDGPRAVLKFLTSPPAGISGSHGNLVLATHDYHYRHPIDERTKQPVVVRAIEQWFVELDTVRNDIYEALESVHFHPKSSESRLHNSILERTEWCISRQRAWGAPIPALYRKNESGSWDAVMTGHSVAHITKIIEQRGIDAWWTDPEDDLAWVAPELDGHAYCRGKDTMDVWFDSSTSWTLLEKTGHDGHVADVYLEGSDQHRCWFQTSLLTYVAHQSGDKPGHNRKPIVAPYRTLITNGFTLDQKGVKMSKSIGNVITPAEIISGEFTEGQHPKTSANKQHVNGGFSSSDHQDRSPRKDGLVGTDTLRLWVASCDYTKDIVVSHGAVKAVHHSMEKLRATLKWLLGVLDPLEKCLLTGRRIGDTSGRFADTLILHRLSLTAHTVHEAYSSYNHARAVTVINHFINHDLSEFYVETAKDRLYAGGPTERAVTQDVLLVIFDEIVRMVGPITPMLVEEVVAHTPQPVSQSLIQRRQVYDATERDWHPLRSVWRPYTLHAPISFTSQSLNRQYATVLGVQSAVHTSQNLARARGKIGTSLDCVVQLDILEEILRDPSFSFLTKLEHEWANLLIMSGCETNRESDQTGNNGTHEAEQHSQTWNFSAPIYVKEPPKDGSCIDDGNEPKRLIGTAVIRPARGNKCSRCSQRNASEVDMLCARCETLLRDIDAYCGFHQAI